MANEFSELIRLRLGNICKIREIAVMIICEIFQMICLQPLGDFEGSIEGPIEMGYHSLG